MITCKEGNILESGTQAVVNTVNTVGVMGKGIALQFREAFPENTHAYLAITKDKGLKPGDILVVRVHSLKGVEYVFNFATKAHWRSPSQIAWIKQGLIQLKEEIIRHNIRSIAIPPLGCGNGGLDWNEVKPLIVSALSGVDAEIVIYEPSALIKAQLAIQERQAPKLTPPRAMLLHLLYQYRALGEFISEFAAEKLSYFLQRFGESQLRLDFKKGMYGPYSGKVKHLLYALNGYYIKGYEQKDTAAFEPLHIVMEKTGEVKAFVSSELDEPQRLRLQKLQGFITGFETPYGLELLATVDYLIDTEKTIAPEVIFSQIQGWSHRKKNMFPLAHVELAVSHLLSYKEDLYPALL